MGISVNMTLTYEQLRQFFPQGLQYPVLGVRTQAFGQNKVDYSQFGMKGHNGLDFSCPVGTTVVAPFDGDVERATTDNGYGKYVRLRSKPITVGTQTYKLEAVFGHLSEFLVSVGTPVQQGAPIAKSGNTGFSTGPHLHFGVRFVMKKSDVWTVLEADNDYTGYFDPDPLMNLRLTLAPYEGKVVYCAEKQVGARHYIVRGGELYWVEDEVAFSLAGFTFKDAVQLHPAAVLLKEAKVYKPELQTSQAEALRQLLHLVINDTPRAKMLYKKYFG